MAFNDDELTLEELDQITAGIRIGKTEEMLDKLSKDELAQLKTKVEKEISTSKIESVKSGIMQEMEEEAKIQNPDLFHK